MLIECDGEDASARTGAVATLWESMRARDEVGVGRMADSEMKQGSPMHVSCCGKCNPFSTSAALWLHPCSCSFGASKKSQAEIRHQKCLHQHQHQHQHQHPNRTPPSAWNNDDSPPTHQPVGTGVRCRDAKGVPSSQDDAAQSQPHLVVLFLDPTRRIWVGARSSSPSRGSSSPSSSLCPARVRGARGSWYAARPVPAGES